MSEPLAPGIRRFGNFLRKAPSVSTMSVEHIAKMQANRQRNLITTLISGAPRRGVKLEDRVIPGATGPIPIRIYTPARTPAAPRPLVLGIHGGGFVLGNLNIADWMCSSVAHDLDAIVVSVDYRLAPANPFPAAVEDCWDALCWAAQNAASLGATAGKLGVMGESAGGNLSAVMCLMARERGGPRIDHQALIYPSVDPFSDTDSRRRNADEIILTAKDMKTFHHYYFGPSPDQNDWRIAPLRAASHAGLPPALIQIAGHDVLRDEGELYARALEAVGVAVTLTEYPAMPHGFVNFPHFSRDARPAIAEIVAEQRRVFARA
jgi:acetyl esterase